MKKNLSIVLSLTLAAILASSVFGAEKPKGPSGETLFKEKCSACHPDGGNIINPQKTLKKKDLTANKLADAKKIVAYVRKPGPGMNAFDVKSLPDADAKAIATYILKTFK
jgi:cytochrome c6